MPGPIAPSTPLLDDRIAALLGPPARPARVPGAARLPLPAAPPSPPPSPPPARPPAPQAMAPQQPRKAAQQRVADEPPARDIRPPFTAWDEAGVAVVTERDGGGAQDGGGAGRQGDEGGGFPLDAAPLPLDDGLTPAEIAALLPGAEASGVFEVLLPDGSALGVAVDASADTVCYLLTPESDALAARLRGQQMELAGQVERRIGRSVRLTVL